MHYENVGFPVLLMDTIGKYDSNCRSRDCTRSPTINETHSPTNFYVYDVKYSVKATSRLYKRTELLCLTYCYAHSLGASLKKATSGSCEMFFRKLNNEPNVGS